VKSLRRIRKRVLGRCYELSLRAVLREPASARLRLVHGWYDDHQDVGLCNHAWVLLPNSRVYDALADEYFSAFEYAVRYRAIVGRIYTRAQAERLSLRHKSPGPWWSDEEAELALEYVGLPF
jgi:hypothetical protein